MAVTTFGSSTAAGSFPTTDTVPATGSVLDSQMQSAEQIAASLTAASFTSDYMNGSTSQAAQFVTGNTVNAAGVQWIAYQLLPEADRVTLQQQMVTAGALSAAAVSGQASTTSNDAFRRLLGIAQSQSAPGKPPIPVGTLLAQADENGIGPIQQQLSANVASATAEEAKPLAISETNPSTIEAAANQAWTQTLGYAPSASQLSGMVSLIQGQDASAQEAPRTAAKEEIAQSQTEESALNKLGPDGVDTVIAAYHSAVNGLGVPGAGTTQGPSTGLVGAAGAPAPPTPMRQPGGPTDANAPGPSTGTGTPAPSGQFPSGQPGQPAAIGALSDLNRQVGALPAAIAQTGSDLQGAATAVRSGLSSAENSLGRTVEGIPNLFESWIKKSNPGLNPPSSSTTTTTTPSAPGATPTRASTPAASPATNYPNFGAYASSFGGMFALSPTEWKAAVALTPKAAAYTTAGAAPESIQLSAFTNLLLDRYQSNGNSWSKAIEQIAGGTDVGESKGAHLSSFATGVANQVDDQIKAVQSQVAAPIDVKVTQPDIAAETNLAAKNSDPIGYAASNYSSWAGTMSQMLYGSPTTEQNPTSDTFTGPVSPGAEAASTPVAAAA